MHKYMPVCPACKSNDVLMCGEPVRHWACQCCRHRWLDVSDPTQQQRHYAFLRGRNFVHAPSHELKMQRRMEDIEPLLNPGMRILEIGCAEGDLGRRIKARMAVDYTGIEISEDADEAGQWLDHVFRAPASQFQAEPFDLILAFHVLEHISDIGDELAHWLRQLRLDGHLVVEVPNEVGHPLLTWDPNPEHLHQFSVCSLAALFERSGLSIKRLTTGHFESVGYPDSLRILANRREAAEDRHARFRAHVHSIIDRPFVIYGVGGDFDKYVLPLLDSLPVAALVDSDSARHETMVHGHKVTAFDAHRYAGIPILVATIRFKAEIAAILREQGVPDRLIYGLDAVLG
jgi:2-polyprenyl-3-methyl-5-hydroxy-6-metoxy-1,4-benzoquinol methylase